MADENIRWSPRLWALREMPPNLQPQVRQLEGHQFLITDRINGDQVYVRRVGYNRFQWGISSPPTTYHN